MKTILEIYEDLRNIEKLLTDAILYFTNNKKEHKDFFKNWKMINNLKIIRFGLRQILQLIENNTDTTNRISTIKKN